MAMKVNIVFLICVAIVSVSGQFVETEYRLDSAPLPIRRRTNNAQYEIQPSIGQEIEFSTQTTRTSNQGRRHIEQNHKSNLRTGQINTNVEYLETKPFENTYITGPEHYETKAPNRQTYDSENQFNARLKEQNLENYGKETNTQLYNRNLELQNENRRNNEGMTLKTNLDNPHNNHHRNNQPNYQSNHDLRTSENSANQNRNIHEDSRQSLNRTLNHQDDQPNYAFNSNVPINQGPINQQGQNIRTNYNRENLNNNRRAEANLRAIDSNGHGQQKIDSTINNRNYNTKPSRQNTETTRQYDNRNYETTEITRRITIDDKSYTGGLKSTDDNELTSKSHPEGRRGNNDDEKWIWSNGGGKSTKTTIVPTNPTVDDRAAFSGDKCPTGQVRFNNMCVDID